MMSLLIPHAPSLALLFTNYGIASNPIRHIGPNYFSVYPPNYYQFPDIAPLLA